MNEFDLSFGTDVYCTDGKCGRLRAVAVNRDNKEVTHIIVEEGFLLKKAHVFPASLVAHVTDTVGLSIASEAAAGFPDFREDVIETPADGGTTGYAGGGYSAAPAPVMVRQKVRQGVPDDRAVLERGLPVISPDGREGKLEHLIISADDRHITHLVLQSGVLFTSQRLVPVEMIESISESAIYINASPEQMDELQPYVRAAFEEGSGLDEQARIEAARMEESPATAATATTPAKQAPPTPAATNGPARHSPEELKYRVAQALDEDRRTADEPIEVIVEGNIVTLSGFVSTAQTRAAAEAIAAEQPGVLSVVNTLKVDNF